MDKANAISKLKYLQNALIAFATQDDFDTEQYEEIRLDILRSPVYKHKAPDILKFKDFNHFWPYIKDKFSSYAERRGYIYDQFAPFIDSLELEDNCPSDSFNTNIIDALGEGYITDEWQKALQRRSTDPKGAITAARTLVETTCKFILDKLNIDYKDSWDLPELYKTTVEQLNLAPSQHTEPTIKKILGGCNSIVIEIGSLRNRISDSHGQGIKKENPYARHAALAVNTAGTLATFLLQTYEFRYDND